MDFFVHCVFESFGNALLKIRMYTNAVVLWSIFSVFTFVYTNVYKCKQLAKNNENCVKNVIKKCNFYVYRAHIDVIQLGWSYVRER